MDHSEKQLAHDTINAMPDDCTLEDIAERIKFMVGVKKGIDQLDRGEGIPHDELKRQLEITFLNFKLTVIIFAFGFRTALGRRRSKTLAPKGPYGHGRS